jgi:hypothetical protein
MPENQPARTPRRRARSNRKGGRHRLGIHGRLHIGTPGRLRRNPHACKVCTIAHREPIHRRFKLHNVRRHVQQRARCKAALKGKEGRGRQLSDGAHLGRAWLDRHPPGRKAVDCQLEGSQGALSTLISPPKRGLDGREEWFGAVPLEAFGVRQTLGSGPAAQSGLQARLTLNKNTHLSPRSAVVHYSR